MTDERIMLPEVPAPGERRAWETMLAAVDITIEAVTKSVPPTAGVRYVEGENADDYDDGEMPVVLVCPWCNTDALPTSLYVIEYAEGHTFAEEDDSDQTLRFDFDRDRFDEGASEVRYMHTTCCLPLSLPDGWEAKYI